jgi:Ankyrin repeats (3 copies)
MDYYTSVFSTLAYHRLKMTEEKNETGLDDIDRNAWFESFVWTVSNEVKWDTIVDVIDEGELYLAKYVDWDKPFHYATEQGDLGAMEELIEKYKVPVMITTGICERTPLHFAALGGHLDIVEYLVGKGADLECDGRLKYEFPALCCFCHTRRKEC